MKQSFNIQIKYSIGYPYFILGGTEEKAKMYAQFARENDGKRAKLSIDDDISYDMRKYFEGAIVPYFFFQSEVSFKSIKEAREALKLEFGKKKYQRNIKGTIQILVISTSEYRKNDFVAFLERLQGYFMENGFEWPDSEDFKKWRDSSPMIGEIYPPLKRLVDIYNKKNGKL